MAMDASAWRSYESASITMYAALMVLAAFLISWPTSTSSVRISSRLNSVALPVVPFDDGICVVFRPPCAAIV